MQVIKLKTDLKASTKLRVRFSEVDSYDIVWHGNYAIYFEEARRAFGYKYGIDYNDLKAEGLFVPIVRLEADYMRPLKDAQDIEVEAKYIPTEAAKIVFEYKIYAEIEDKRKLMSKGKTVQVMLDENRELIMANPAFIKNWKAKWL